MNKLNMPSIAKEYIQHKLVLLLFETRSAYISQADFKPRILLSQHSEY